MLVVVHLLIAAHIAHWLIAGRTLAPVELNEVLHTVHLGVITVGFVFMALAVVSVFVFGRFFCGWGCHVLALQDLAAWLLQRLRIRVRPIRSRALVWAPVGALVYLFVWPQLDRWWAGRAAPEFRLQTDADGWASFVTSDLWRNLPEPGIAIATFAICGFAVVYLLGSRAFCAYGCPYGVLFGLADRVAPGRILLRGDCTGCGTCTAHCPSGIAVHDEIRRHGAVVDPACLKDVDCVDACPSGALRFGFARPALARGRRHRRGGHFSWAEELLLGAVFVAVVLTWRGLYDAVPLLMALGLAGAFAYGAVVALRLVRRGDVAVAGLPLKRGPRLTRAGWAFAIASVSLAILTAHSAFIRYHEHAGRRLFDAIAAGETSPRHRRAALHHFDLAERFGLVTPAALHRRVASLHRLGGDDAALIARLRMSTPDDPEARLWLGTALKRTGAVAEAERLLLDVVDEVDPAPREAVLGEAWHDLADIAARRGDRERAIERFGRALAVDPQRVASHVAIGALLAGVGRTSDARQHLRRALALDPISLPAHNNLAVVLARDGELDAAIEILSAAARLAPRDETARANLGALLVARHRSQRIED